MKPKLVCESLKAFLNEEFVLDVDKDIWEDEIEPILTSEGIPFKKRSETIWKNEVGIVFFDRESFELALEIENELALK